MNWSDTQLAELNYFCHSTRSRVPRHFPCYPFSWQIDVIIDLFFYYSFTEFHLMDIKEFYKILRIPKPRSDGLRTPSSRQIAQALGKMENIRLLEENRYQILRPNNYFAKFYADELEYGYAKGYVQYFMEEHTC